MGGQKLTLLVFEVQQLTKSRRMVEVGGEGSDAAAKETSPGFLGAFSSQLITCGYQHALTLSTVLSYVPASEASGHDDNTAR